jgi:hypothetical protein
MTGKFHTLLGRLRLLTRTRPRCSSSASRWSRWGGLLGRGQLPPRGGSTRHTTTDRRSTAGSRRASRSAGGRSRVNEVAVLPPRRSSSGRPDFKFRRSANSPRSSGRSGCCRKLRVQFDIVDDEADYAPYKVLVMPDEAGGRRHAGDEARRVRRGGRLTDRLAPVGGSRPTARTPSRRRSPNFSASATPVTPRSARIPDADTRDERARGADRHRATSMYKKGTKVKAADGVETLATLQSPYFNRTGATSAPTCMRRPRGRCRYPAAVRGQLRLLRPPDLRPVPGERTALVPERWSPRPRPAAPRAAV